MAKTNSNIVEKPFSQHKTAQHKLGMKTIKMTGLSMAIVGAFMMHLPHATLYVFYEGLLMASIGLVLSFIGASRKSIFGADSIKIQTKNGKLALELEKKNGLLDSVGYHNHYSTVCVDKVLRDLSITLLGLDKDFANLEQLKGSEKYLKASRKQQKRDLDNKKCVKGVNTKPETQALNKTKQDAKKAHDQVEKTKARLEGLISNRTLDVLNANKHFFSIDEQKKINSNYVKEAVKSKFAL
ncbi:MAG: hypothetical protein AB7I18_10085 [Candidatus Berkiella sp.]